MKNESVKKSLEKSKNVLEEKRKTVKRKICIKKDTHVYNNCYELRSRAIKNHSILINAQNRPERTSICYHIWENQLHQKNFETNKTALQ